MASVLTTLATQTGQQASSGNGSITAVPSVTAGSVLLVMINAYNSAGVSAPTLAQSAGTATLGTPVLDVGPVELLSVGTQAASYVYRIPVTGSGSLTLGLTSSNMLVTWNFIEVSGLASTPGDGTNTNSGTSGSESTGAVSTTTSGLTVGIFLDATASTETYSAPSGTRIMNFGNVALLKGYSQYAIFGAAGSRNMTLTMSPTGNWQGAIAAYQDAPIPPSTIADENFEKTRGICAGVGRGAR